MNTNNFISCLHILGSWHFGCNLKKGQCKAKYKLHIQVLKGWSLSLKVSAQIQTILAVLIFWAAPFSAQCSFPFRQQSSLSRCSTGLSCFTLCYLIFCTNTFMSGVFYTFVVNVDKSIIFRAIYYWYTIAALHWWFHLFDLMQI